MYCTHAKFLSLYIFLKVAICLIPYVHKYVHIKGYHLRIKLVPKKADMDMTEFNADNRFTANVALSPSHAYSSSAIGVNKLLVSA